MCSGTSFHLQRISGNQRKSMRKISVIAITLAALFASIGLANHCFAKTYPDYPTAPVRLAVPGMGDVILHPYAPPKSKPKPATHAPMQYKYHPRLQSPESLAG
jgi:hypothetical protein